MPRRNRKNGRFSKTTSRRRKSKSFSVGKAAETALVANAAIRGMFATNLPTFLTGRDIADGFNNGANNSNEITVPELWNMLMGGSGGIANNFTTDGGGLGGAIKSNLRRNGFDMAWQMVGIPIAFRIGRKLLAKPLINPTNRMLKQVGLKEVKL